MIVAFEGMDGCGKSTTALEVSKRIGYKHESQRLMSLLNVDKDNFDKFVKVVRTSKNSKLAFFFYTFRCMLDRDIPEDTIVERTMMSTYYFENEKVSEEEWNMIMSNPIIPDITFLLYASPEVRYQRIYGRNKNDIDLNSNEALNDGYFQMIEFAKKYNIPYIGINTEKYNMEQVIEICSAVTKYYSMLKTDSEKIEFIKVMNEKYGFDNLYLLGGDNYARKIRLNTDRNGS